MPTPILKSSRSSLPQFSLTAWAWFSLLSSQKIMAGFLATSSRMSRKLPMPFSRSMSTMSVISSQWSTFETPVANTPCQKSVIFSWRGAWVFIMWWSQVEWPMPWTVPGFHVHPWYLRSSYLSTGSCSSGLSSSSTVAS